MSCEYLCCLHVLALQQSEIVMLQATYNGTGQPGPTDTWSAFDLSFSGSNCSSELLGYNGAGQLGTGPPARFNGTLAVVTGVAPANTTGVVTA